MKFLHHVAEDMAVERKNEMSEVGVDAHLTRDSQEVGWEWNYVSDSFGNVLGNCSI